MSYYNDIKRKTKHTLQNIYITFPTFHVQMMSLLSHFCFSLNSDCTYTRCAIQCSYVSSQHYTHGCWTVQLYILHILPILSSNIDPFLLQVRRVVVFRRVCCELLSKGREWVATWRTTARGLVPGLGDSRGVAWLGVVTLTVRLVTAWV
jgi:hypothetical protein